MLCNLSHRCRPITASTWILNTSLSSWFPLIHRLSLQNTASLLVTIGLKEPVSAGLRFWLSVFVSNSKPLFFASVTSDRMEGRGDQPSAASPLSCPQGRVLCCRQGGGRKLCLLTVTLNFLRWGINIEILKWKMRQAQRGWEGRRGRGRGRETERERVWTCAAGALV